MVDEDLGEEIFSNYQPKSLSKSDCSNKKQACANCTCGRKEAEAVMKTEEAQKMASEGTAKSSCGSVSTVYLWRRHFFCSVTWATHSVVLRVRMRACRRLSRARRWLWTWMRAI